MRTASFLLLFLTACPPVTEDTVDTDVDSDSDSDSASTTPFAPSASQGFDEDPSLLRLQDGTYRLAWYSDRSGNNEIWWSSSDDARTWSEPELLVENSGNDHYPCLFQTTNGTLHLAWQRIVGTEFPNVYIKHSVDGTTWSAEAALTTDTANLDWAPELFETPSGLQLIFSSDRSGNRELYQQQSVDDGLTWTSPVAITDDPATDDFAQVVVIGSRAHLVWNRWTTTEPIPTFPSDDATVRVAESADGSTWESPTALTTTVENNVLPTVFDAEGAAFAAWTTTATGDPFGDIVVLATASGPASGSETALTTAITPDFSARIAPGESAGDYVMAFTSDREGNFDIYVLHFTLP